MTSMEDLFHKTEGLIYLNSGTHSLTPKKIIEKQKKYLEEYNYNPCKNLRNNWTHLWEIQKNLGHYFNADPKDLFLRNNVTEVMNSVILGIPLKSGSEILTTNLEYGAVLNICKFRAQRDQIKLNIAPIVSNFSDIQTYSENDWVESLWKHVTPNTSAIVVSHVFTGTGLIYPIEKLAERTSKANIPLIVDGAHSAGAIILDFSRLQYVDYYGANLHKWMLGPKGTGFGWVNKKRQAELQCISAGWTSFAAPSDATFFGEGDRFSCRMVIANCQDFSRFYALEDLLDLWKTLGFANINQQRESLKQSVKANFESRLEWKSLCSTNKSLNGPLISYQLPKKFALNSQLKISEVLFRKYNLEIACPRVFDEWVLRISPHVHNNQEEILKATNFVKEYFST